MPPSASSNNGSEIERLLRGRSASSRSAESTFARLGCLLPALIELARELERQVGTKKDLLVPLPRTQHRTAEDGECALEIEEPTGVQRYGITALARRQLAEKLRTPYAYFERMRTEQPELLDRDVNAWLAKEEGGVSSSGRLTGACARSCRSAIGASTTTT